MLTIKKKAKIYVITELEKKWKISISIFAIPFEYEVSKKDCPDFESLRIFVLGNDIF